MIKEIKKVSGKKHRLRFLKYLVLSFFSFILLLVLIAEVFEKKITALTFEQIKETVDLPIDVGDISFTLLRSFPLASIELKNVTLGSPVDTTLADSAQDICDTLVCVENVYFSVEAMPLTDGIFDIRKIEVEGVKVRFFKDRNGKSNFDFLIDTTKNEQPDTASLLPDITLQNFMLKDFTCYYSDSMMSTKAKISIPEITLKGRVKNNTYSGDIKGSADVAEARFRETNIDRMKNARLDFDIAYVNDSLTVSSFVLISDGVVMNVTGSAVVRDEIFADINISSENIDLAELKKYIPDDTLKSYGIKNIAGNMLFNAKIRGVVSDSVNMPAVDADIWLKNGSVVTAKYPVLKNLSFNVAYTNGTKQNEETSEIDLKKFHFETKDGKGDVKGFVRNFNNLKYLVKGNLSFDLSEFAGLIPDTLLSSVDGDVKVNFSTKGTLPDSVNDEFINRALQNSLADITLKNVDLLSDSFPDVRSLSGNIVYRPGSFDVENLNVSVPDYKLKLTNSSLKALPEGDLTDPSKTTLDIKSFLVQTDRCSFSGSAFVKNLLSPEFRVKLDMKLDLAEAKTMLPDSLITDMSGVVEASVETAGRVNPDSLIEQLNDIVFKQTNISAYFNDVSVAMPDTLISVSGFSGRVALTPEAVTFENVTGSYKTISFNVPRLNILNVYSTVVLNRKDTLKVEGEFNIGDADYAMFAPFTEDTTAEEETADVSEQKNYSFSIKGKVSVNSFTYNKAVFRNLSALYNLTDSLYIIDKFNFEAFGGKAGNSVRYRLKPDGNTVINTKHVVEGVDIHRLLRDFDNFKEYGNDEIAAENIGGFFSSSLHTKIVMAGDSVLGNETRVKGEFRIGNGGIYNYKAAMDMAEFTKLKELDSIRFKTFDSKIFMFKNKLYVPKTYIVSSALDIGFFGMQSMDEDYEYHVMLHLGDVLKGKSQKLLKRQAETGDEVTGKDLDRSTVKLIYAYIDGKAKVGFDRKKVQRMMQVKIKTQEKMLDLIFFPKLVSFDTGVKE